MKKYILFLLFLTSSFIYSQSDNSIISNSNKELLVKLKKIQKEKNKRISDYLLQNKDKPLIKYDEKGGISKISDIINGQPIYTSTYNVNAAANTKTNQLQVGGALGLDLDGTGLTVGVWDGGPADNTHPEFNDPSGLNSRIIIMDQTTVDGDVGFSTHGTHVTGTIAARGANANAKGMATNVTIKSYNWDNDDVEMVSAANAGPNSIFLSNHSYGIPVVGSPAWLMGAYSQDARTTDEIAHNNPKYLIVAAAGNAGTDNYSGGLYNGYDKLTTNKNAKNNLVIANANPNFNPFTNELELNINTSSSQGPTDDLRIKPDIAGDGTNLFSSTPNNSYSTFSGTSMSSPNLTGSLLLLQEYYNQLNGEFMNASTLKGLVCHTALDDSNIGPDPIFGWGLLDSKFAAETILADNNQVAIIEELTLNNNDSYSLTFDAIAGEKLMATICWTDVPGAAVNNVANDQTPKLVNDLDLRITKNGTTYLPWKLNYSSSSGFTNSKDDNTRDNIEKIEINTPENGTYTLTVTHKGLLQVANPFSDPRIQNFSLIVTGNNLTLNNEDFNFETKNSIYPNPTSDIITLKTKNHISKIEVFNTIGKLLLTNYNTKTINLENLPNGLYIVKSYNKNSFVVNKVIKQ